MLQFTGTNGSIIWSTLNAQQKLRFIDTGILITLNTLNIWNTLNICNIFLPSAIQLSWKIALVQKSI